MLRQQLLQLVGRHGRNSGQHAGEVALRVQAVAFVSAPRTASLVESEVAALRDIARLNTPTEANRLFHNTINLRGYRQAVEGLDVTTARGAATFWSGPGNFAKARAFAAGNGGAVLEMTPGGTWLQNQALFKRLPGEMAIQPWQRLSTRFAAGASGDVNAFVRGARLDRTFYQIEYPILSNNPDVMIIFH